jgi:hypothetical protein
MATTSMKIGTVHGNKTQHCPIANMGSGFEHVN